MGKKERDRLLKKLKSSELWVAEKDLIQEWVGQKKEDYFNAEIKEDNSFLLTIKGGISALEELIHFIDKAEKDKEE